MSIYNQDIPSLECVFKDFDHPNPTINRKAFIDMHRFWLNESMIKLVANLNSEDLILRRKSVKAIASFGKDVVKDIVDLYSSNKDEVVRLSCIKILVLIASCYNMNDFADDVKGVLLTAVEYESSEMILIVISLLKQLGQSSIPLLKNLCRDKNVLRAKASLTALNELNDPSTEKFLESIYNDSCLDEMIRESAFQLLPLSKQSINY